MEADCLWFKKQGVVVLEKCVFGYSFFGHPDDYIYDSVVIDYKKRTMWVYDGNRAHVWSSDTHLIVPNIFLIHFIEQRLAHKSSTNVYEMILLANEFFNTDCDTGIIISHVQSHYRTILDPLANYIPATVIQKTWKKCISNPNYTMCKSRLLREFIMLDPNASF